MIPKELRDLENNTRPCNRLSRSSTRHLQLSYPLQKEKMLRDQVKHFLDLILEQILKKRIHWRQIPSRAP